MFVKFAKEIGNKGFTVNVTINDRDALSTFEAATMLNTEAEAIEFAGKFAKSLKVKGSTITGYDKGVQIVNGWVTFRASLSSDNVTGERNETSINRITKFLAACEKLNLVLDFTNNHCSNQLRDRAEFETKLAAL